MTTADLKNLSDDEAIAQAEAMDRTQLGSFARMKDLCRRLEAARAAIVKLTRAMVEDQFPDVMEAGRDINEREMMFYRLGCQAMRCRYSAALAAKKEGAK